jgi:putative ABC transport system substrate-binding protein
MTVTIGRRELLVALGGAAAAWPFAARAQQGERMKRLGILMAYPEGDQEGQAFLTAFREELEKLGWMESRNLWIDTRWAPAADAELRLKFAKELVALHPDLILSHGTPSTATLLQQTRTLPILFVNVTDPIGRLPDEFCQAGWQRHRFH